VQDICPHLKWYFTKVLVNRYSLWDATPPVGPLPQVQTLLTEGQSMLLVLDGTSTPPTFTPFPCFHKSFCAFLTLVEQNSCQSSTCSDCVQLNCQCPAVRNRNQSLRCGVLLRWGHSGVNCKKISQCAPAGYGFIPYVLILSVALEHKLTQASSCPCPDISRGMGITLRCNAIQGLVHIQHILWVLVEQISCWTST